LLKLNKKKKKTHSLIQQQQQQKMKKKKRDPNATTLIDNGSGSFGIFKGFDLQYFFNWTYHFVLYIQ